MSKLAFAAIAAVALLSGQAMADEVRNTAVVPTAAVDFNNRTQVQAVYDHITAVARDLCTMNSANPTLARPEAACVNQAVADAVAHTNRPLLTAAYEARTAPGAPARALAGNDQ